MNHRACSKTRRGLLPRNHSLLRDNRADHASADTNGYRSFCDSDVHKLTFLARARTLGVTI